MVHIVEIQAQLSWIVFQDPLSKRWIGVCEPLRITLGSESQADLVETIDDSIQALLMDLWQQNEFEQFMRSRGWRPMTPLPAEKTEQVRFDVPMDILMRSARDYQNPVYQ
jgi:hypothetical protein